MGHTEPLRVEISIETVSEAGPLSGVILANGDRRPFSGWMGLILGLDTVINSPRESEQPPPCQA